jgi:glycosyltransferase involved in cell wall biosynthesis
MLKKQKIFIEATPLINSHLSGVGQVTLETINAFDNDKYKDKYDIRVFVPFDEKSKMEKYSFNNISIVTLPFPHKFFSLFSRMHYAIPLDIFLGRGVYIFPNFRNWNLVVSKSITYIHDVCFAIYPQYVQPKNLSFLRKHIKLWVRRTDKIVTVSKTSKYEIHKYLKFRNSSISVIQNTIDGSFYKPQISSHVDRIKTKYKLDNYFLFVGNIEPRKNLNTLIEAFERSQLKDITLFIVGGDGWLNEEIYESIERAKSNGVDIRKNTSFVPDEDLPALFSGANALLLPSWHEGFGLTALQALACGTRVLCSDIPVLKEITESYGNRVDYFEPSDSAALKELMIKYGKSKKDAVKPITVNRTWQDAADELLLMTEEMKRDN